MMVAREVFCYDGDVGVRVAGAEFEGGGQADHAGAEYDVGRG